MSGYFGEPMRCAWCDQKFWYTFELIAHEREHRQEELQKIADGLVKASIEWLKKGE